MNSITEQQFEELAKRYPDLFLKAKIDRINVGIGWYSLIDTLCEKISETVEQTRFQIRYLTDNNNAGENWARINELEIMLAADINELPTLINIKEKFGGMYISVQDGSVTIQNFISFVHTLSMHTCEHCGMPGTARNDGWTKTLCNKHHRERENDNHYGLGAFNVYSTPLSVTSNPYVSDTASVNKLDQPAPEP